MASSRAFCSKLQVFGIVVLVAHASGAYIDLLKKRRKPINTLKCRDLGCSVCKLVSIYMIFIYIYIYIYTFNYRHTLHTSYIIGFGVLGDLLALKRVKNARSAFLLVFSHHETKQIYATTCLLGWMGRGVGMGCRCNHLQRFVGFVGCMLPSKT